MDGAIDIFRFLVNHMTLIKVATTLNACSIRFRSAVSGSMAQLVHFMVEIMFVGWVSVCVPGCLVFSIMVHIPRLIKAMMQRAGVGGNV